MTRKPIIWAYALLLLCANAPVFAAPEVATLISPSATIYNQPVFNWQDQTDATEFRLYVYDRSTSQRIHLTNYDRSEVCADGDCSVSIDTDLTFGTNHFWKIRSRNADGYAAWSSAMRFDYVEWQPSTPIAQGPLGDISSSTPTFQWERVSNAVDYQIYVYDRTVGSRVLLSRYTNDEICSDTVCSVTPDGLNMELGANHFWKVRARNSGGNSAYTENQVFDYIDTVPERVISIAPSDSVDTASPTYSWIPTDRATQYQLRVRNRGTASWVVNERFDFDDICDDSGCLVTASGDLEGDASDMYFRVRGINSGGNGAWSAVRNFSYVESSTPTEGFVFSRSDTDENWWIDTNAAGVLGRVWIDSACVSTLGGATETGDWFALVGFSPDAQVNTVDVPDACGSDTGGGDTGSGTGFVFSRSDTDENWWIDTNAAGVLGRVWIDSTCVSTLGGATETGDWFALVGFSPDAQVNTVDVPDACGSDTGGGDTGSGTGFVFSRSDTDENWWIDTNAAGVLGRVWIDSDCVSTLGGATETGDWFALVGISPDNQVGTVEVPVACEGTGGPATIVDLPGNDSFDEFSYFENTAFGQPNGEQGTLEFDNDLLTRLLPSTPETRDEYHADNWYRENDEGEEGIGNFRVSCQWSHFNYDDPIVYPGEPAEAHLHMYFGNTVANNNTIDGTALIAQGGGSCNGFALNRSSYWMPAVMDGSMRKAVVPKEIIVYYKTRTVCKNPLGLLPLCEEYRVNDRPDETTIMLPLDEQGFSHQPNDVVAMPQGLELISGNGIGPIGRDTDDDEVNTVVNAPGMGVDLNQLTDDDPVSEHVFWSCGSSGSVIKKYNRMPTKDECIQAAEDDGITVDLSQLSINATVYFPQCWTGNEADLATEDGLKWEYVRQVAVNESCPVGFEHRMPQLGFLLYWSLDGVDSTDDWFLSSDMIMEDGEVLLDENGDPTIGKAGGTLHADWMAAWDEDTMEKWIDDCLKAEKNCSIGQMGGQRRLRDIGAFQVTQPVDYILDVPTRTEVRSLR